MVLVARRVTVRKGIVRGEIVPMVPVVRRVSAVMGTARGGIVPMVLVARRVTVRRVTVRGGIVPMVPVVHTVTVATATVRREVVPRDRGRPGRVRPVVLAPVARVREIVDHADCWRRLSGQAAGGPRRP